MSLKSSILASAWLRNTLFLVVLLSLPLLATAQSRTIKSEMEWLHKARDINFVYDSDIPTNKPYNGPSLKNLSTPKALSTLFNGTGIAYRRQGSYVTLSYVHAFHSPAKSATPNVPAPDTRSRHTISGYVHGTGGETLINATVYDLTSHQGTTTNAYGYYSLTLADGQHRIRFGYIGYDDHIYNVKLSTNHNTDITLNENASLEDVIVTGDLNSPLLTTQTGKRSLPAADIKTEFSLMSSPDVVKTLQITSGVNSGVELASGLYVHGGDADENLFLIDGSPLYSVNHTLGLFSSFNVDVVKNVDFYKSGFPARYGGRLSSVVDVRTADGDFHHLHGSYRIGLLDGSFQLEGPLRKNKTSFNIGLRRSWLDLITRPIFAIRNHYNDDDDINFNYFFHDLNAKVTNIFSNRSRLSLSLYSGEDNMHVKDELNDNYGNNSYDKDITKERFSWGNLNAAIDWQYRFSPKLFANFTAFYTYNRSHVKDTEDNGSVVEGKEASTNWTSSTYRSTINDLGYSMSFDFRPSPHHHIRFGTDYTWHSFRPQSHNDKTYYGESDKVDTTSTVSRNSHKASEWNFYAEDEVSMNDHWSLNVGMNASLFHITDKTFSCFDPRVSLKFQMSPKLSFKASATVMSQYVHKIANTFLELPTDYWVPTTANLHPMRSVQYAAGIYFQPDSRWILSLEGYIKRTRHILQYASWTGLEPPAENWDELVMDGHGRFYGLEFDGLYKTKDLTLQGSYTISWNKRKYSEFYPKWFYDKFDNRHKINLLARWKISQKVSMLANWSFHTGNHISVPTQYVHMPNVPDGKPVFLNGNSEGQLSDGTEAEWMHGAESCDLEGFVYEKPSNMTLPAYHRLDIGFDFKHKTKHGHDIIWNISVYNLYCHMNSMWVDVKFNDHTGRMELRNHAYIPVIPSVSYTYKF